VAVGEWMAEKVVGVGTKRHKRKEMTKLRRERTMERYQIVHEMYAIGCNQTANSGKTAFVCSYNIYTESNASHPHVADALVSRDTFVVTNKALAEDSRTWSVSLFL